MMYTALNTILGEDLWYCNLSVKDVDTVIIENSFWKDVMKQWAKYNYHTPVGANAVGEQRLWYNSHIRRAGGPFIYPHWYMAGIKRISDVYNSKEGRWLSVQEMETCYGCCINWLEYQGLVAALPAFWLTVMQHNYESPGTYQVRFDKLLTAK